MPHTISKPPLSLSPFLHTPAGFKCPMYYGWGEEKKKNTVPVIYMIHEITGKARLKWSNKACGHKYRERERKKSCRGHVS